MLKYNMKNDILFTDWKREADTMKKMKVLIGNYGTSHSAPRKRGSARSCWIWIWSTPTSG